MNKRIKIKQFKHRYKNRNLRLCDIYWVSLKTKKYFCEVYKIGLYDIIPIGGSYISPSILSIANHFNHWENLNLRPLYNESVPKISYLDFKYENVITPEVILIPGQCTDYIPSPGFPHSSFNKYFKEKGI